MIATHASALIGLFALGSVSALPLPARSAVFERQSTESSTRILQGDLASSTGNATALFNGTASLNATELCATALYSNGSLTLGDTTFPGNATLGNSTLGNLTFLCNIMGNDSVFTAAENTTSTVIVPGIQENDGMDDCDDYEEDGTSTFAFGPATTFTVDTSSAVETQAYSSYPTEATSAPAAAMATAVAQAASSVVASSAVKSPLDAVSPVVSSTSTATQTTSTADSISAASTTPAPAVDLIASTTSSSAAAASTSTSTSTSTGVLSQADIDEYLAKHNAARQRYNAVVLTWDADVAAVAQAWADQCHWGHSGNENFGENIAAGQDLKISDTVDMWVGEETDFDFANPTYNHFTQARPDTIVWKSTHYLGCGIADCHDPDTNAPFKYHVCNYKEPGNYLGEFAANVDKVTCTDC